MRILCGDPGKQPGLHALLTQGWSGCDLAGHGADSRRCERQREVRIPITCHRVVVTKPRVDFAIWNDSHELQLEA